MFEAQTLVQDSNCHLDRGWGSGFRVRVLGDKAIMMTMTALMPAMLLIKGVTVFTISIIAFLVVTVMLAYSPP